MRIGKLSQWTVLIFLSLILLSGQARASEEGTVTVGITPNPLAVSVFAPDEVYKDSHFIVRAQIQNLGDERITGAVATIHFDKKGFSLGGRRPEQRLGTIPPHRERTITWPFEALKKGNYVVLVSVSGMGEPGELTAQDSAMVIVKERHRRFFDFFPDWWRDLFGGWRK